MQQYPYQTSDEQPTVFTNGSNAVLNTAESAQTAHNSAMVKCPYYKYASAGCPIFGGACKPVPCKLQRALHQ
jgi:aspartate/methionine/tyrosine aminotransferase